VEYSGPHLSRKQVPNTALFRLEKTADGKSYFTNGLNYRCFEGQWQKLPPFQNLAPVRTGQTANFDLGVKTRNEYVGLDFDGYIDINQDGVYTFCLTSDDGSVLFINNLPIRLTLAGATNLPAPMPMTIRQPVAGQLGPVWAEVEGVITFVGRQPEDAELELTSDEAHMRVMVSDSSQAAPRYLLGSRARLRGVCLVTSDAAGRRTAATLVAPNWQAVQVLDVAPAVWPTGNRLKIGECLNFKGLEGPGMVDLCGQINSNSPARSLILTDDTGSVPVELLNAAAPPPDAQVECLGRWSRTDSNNILREAVWRELPKPLVSGTNDRPILTTAAQVQGLTREQARHGFRAHVRGVVTWVSGARNCVVIQDQSGRGVFVGLRTNWKWDTPSIGDILEVEGDCDAPEFSPILILAKGEKLGIGTLPAPLHATWDQLISGSMDSQYVEIRGFVTDTQDHHLTLLMAGGKIDVEFDPAPADALNSFVNSVVRIQGCLFAKWDPTTLLVMPEHPLSFGNATICVDVPAPSDPFATHKMRARELMQFDAEGNIFQRVNISGQILSENAGMYYLTDEGFGLRFQPAKPADLTPGDNVEVVGLVELGGPSPILREALARKTGHSPLPPAQPLMMDGSNTTHDAALVWTEGRLVDAKANKTERVLEMQSGLRNFVARLPGDDPSLRQWPPGSLLKLTGVYSELGNGRQPAGMAKSFELLLNSPASVRVVAQPPWWTLSRLLTMVTLLAAGLLLAFFWITLLHRQVERRTTQLKHEISERQRAEHDRAIEQERSRIARDLHDDLGSRLTAINMLAMTGSRSKLTPEASHDRLQLIVDRSRSMVTALDALVWAVNPKNDTLAALAEYLASFVEELLTQANIHCRIELPQYFPARIIASEIRHNTLLSVKEALNNAVRHGKPTEIMLQLKCSGNEFEILIKDNGCGFAPDQHFPGNGLANLKERMRKVNGRCEIQSSPGAGTTVSLALPL
jgi:signal transduction histidine kinase